ncbi:glycosyltransferase family 4 protein [Candidatus Woesearchaeota archaeon]|nr:glycosyltransferase family 4 protein [Candidatus Woesearchaeota archaeon]
MKILVLTSRYTATRDIIGEDFGRQTRLFEALRKFKHDIDFFCADYRKLENKDVKLHGINVFIRAFGFTHFFSFIRDLNEALKKKKYDLLMATSDPLWGIFGYYYAKKYNVKFAYDLHDNYETYLIYSIPFFWLMDRLVINKADIIITVSNSLKKKVGRIRNRKVFVIENGADLALFKPRDRIESRKKLRLPLNAKIIAYSGTLQRMQGIPLLVEAFESLKNDINGLLLVLAGRIRKVKGEILELDKKGIVWLKNLNQKEVVDLINAADVAVMPNPANEFTKYCFPYKIIEYMACNAKIVATEVGDVADITPKECLCKPDSTDALAQKIRFMLNSKSKPSFRKIAERYSWDNMAKKLDKVIRNN